LSGGQIAALIFAILLLLPGGCFLIFGIGFATDTGGFALLLLLSATAILGLAWFLFRIAFRRREGPAETPGGTPC
jgi:hypothetical protein